VPTQLTAHLRLRLLQLALVLAADGRRLLWQLLCRACRGTSALFVRVNTAARPSYSYHKSPGRAS
jgi:hypothetical protein